jgi:hypothetical protein
LLLKPQALMMLGPGLLLAHRWRMLIGLAVGSAGVLGLSALVGGVDGLVAQAELLYRYPGEMPSTQPRDMMNWRAVAVHLSAVLPGAVAWSLAMIGLLVTFLVGLGLWLDRRVIETPEGFTIAVLGTYAATAAVAWHAHTHMLLGLSAPMLVLAARGAIPLRVLGVWFLGPHLIFMVLRVGFDLGNTGVIAVNLYLLGWAILELRRRSTALRSQGVGPAWSREAILPDGQS